MTPLSRIPITTLTALTAATALGVAGCGGDSSRAQVGSTPFDAEIPTNEVGAGFSGPQGASPEGAQDAIVADANTDEIVRVDVDTGVRRTIANADTLIGGTTPAVDRPVAFAQRGDDILVANLPSTDVEDPGTLTRVEGGDGGIRAPILLDFGGLVHRALDLVAVTIPFPVAGDRDLVFVGAQEPDRTGRVVVATVGANGEAVSPYVLDPQPAGVLGEFEADDFARICAVTFLDPLEDDDPDLLGRLVVVGLGPRVDNIGCLPDTDPDPLSTINYNDDRVVFLDLVEDPGAPGRVTVSRAEGRTNLELLQVITVGVATARPVGVSPFFSIPGTVFVANRGTGRLSVIGLNSRGELVLLSVLPPLVDESVRDLSGVNTMSGVGSANIAAPDAVRDRVLVSFTTTGSGSVRLFDSLQP